ncbi:MAG: ATP-binding protein [Magnetospirillum sp.]|nr:ATP-binding protein [Magnetospirillum sp.]
MAAKPISVGTLRRYMVWVTLLWSGAVALSLATAVINVRGQALESAKNEARTSVRTNMGFRRWATQHGGVYVPPDAKTPPNPYLADIPDRDLVTTSGKALTLMNPAYMLRELMGQGYVAKGRITSLKPLNPINAPDPWEVAALRQLQMGATEVSAIVTDGGDPAVRVMLPMVTEAGCLKCHGKQGYKTGDVRGGIDVVTPLGPYLKASAGEVRVLAIGHAFIWLFGVIGIVVTAREGTARIRSQQEVEASLRSSEERFRTMAAVALDAVITIDEDGRITFWNHAAEKMFGYSAAEVAGDDLHRLILPAEVKPGFETGFQAFRNSGGGPVIGRTLTTIGMRRDGARFPVEVSISALPLKERWQAVGVVRDITQRQRRETDLEQAVNRLTETNSELERFAYVASHDLQEPLRNIISFTQLLERRYGGKLGEDADEYIGFIVRSGRRMHAMINDLLAYSRMAGQERAFSHVSSRQACLAAVDNLRDSIAGSGADVSVGDLPEVVADEIQLVQLFQNLIGNAVKFRRPGVAPTVVVAAERQGEGWLFRVADNGIGIETTTHDLFEIFRRQHPPEAYPGTGIGLAICKRIVQRHHGHIWVQSQPGQGSTFFFTLPDAAGP